MLKIRLARFGKRNQPHYRIVVKEAKSKRDGKYTALLGHYAPAQEPKILEMDLKAYKDWVAKGAQPTPTVEHLAARLESGNPFPEKKQKPSKKQQAKKEAKEAPVAEKPADAPAAKDESVAEAEKPEAVGAKSVEPVAEVAADAEDTKTTEKS